MPTSTIPFDPSLALGMIVDPDKIAHLEALAEFRKPVDAARNRYNELRRQKQSLDLTLWELLSLGAPNEQLEPLKNSISELMTELTKAALELGSATVSAEEKIEDSKLKHSQTSIGMQLQSPIDFSASQLKSLPLSSDTMDVNVEYFSYASDESSSRSGANAMSSFVEAKVVPFLGAHYGSQAGASSLEASISAVDQHKVVGTLVICCNCTYKDAKAFSPFKLDPDLALDSYALHQKGGKDGIPIDDLAAMKAIALANSGKEFRNSAMPVIIGASFGSSFIGFINIEKSANAESFQSKAVQVNAEIKAILRQKNDSDSFGLDAQVLGSVRGLLENQDFQSHCSVIKMGLIPSIKSNQTETDAKAPGGGPTERMEQLAAMQNVGDSSVSDLTAREASATKNQVVERMESALIQSSVDTVAQQDKAGNLLIDLNSLMTALDDYVDLVRKRGSTGVPINFYLKYISKQEIAVQWMMKHHPNDLYQPIDSESLHEDDSTKS